MDYQLAVQDMFGRLPMYSKIGAKAYKADLENIQKLCSFLGSPETGFKSIHIAGTNGKGSTSSLLASILQESSLRVGLYTSPHLKDFRERIRINGEMISQKDVLKYYHQIIDYADEIHASFFEMTVAMTFLYFKDQKVDIAIIETGLGGRLDATNIITPELCVITNIGIDHQSFLGENIKDIAAEKAGIFKNKVPAIIGEYQEDVADVFIEKAKELSSPLYFVRDMNLDIKQEQELKIFGQKVKSPLLGTYQVKNIRTAIGAIQLYKQFQNADFITEKSILKGIERVVKNTGLQGRWQILQEHPKIVIDVGHNEDGVKSVVEQLKLEDYKHLHIVYGAVNDKDVLSIFKLLPKDNASYYLCEPPIDRKMSVERLSSMAQEIGLAIAFEHPDAMLVYQKALEQAQEDDLVLVLGSNFIAGEIL